MAAARPLLFRSLARPVQAFFRTEAASGVVLLGCAAAALAWANLAPQGYRAVLDAPVILRVGGAAVSTSLLGLVNDGLMSLFFFVVGLEIKRELVLGELRSPAQALLPAVAAAGGMLLPAALFLAFNAGQPGVHGWGVPMATDIAFSIGVLRLLRGRVSRALVVFVTALAIFDDIGGILVIAVFYGSGVELRWLLGAAAVSLGALGLARAGVRSWGVWGAAGAALWLALHHSGVHPTIAGVILGLAVPARAPRRAREVLRELSTYAGAVASRTEERGEAAIEGIHARLEELEAPLAHFLHVLHPWVAFGVMPLFALANSGLDVMALDATQLTGRVAMGTATALLLGKQLGVFGATLLAVRLGLGRLPRGTTLPKLLGASTVAGIGFTVALFIAGLAYAGNPSLLAEAKLGILAGSLASGMVGFLLLRATGPMES